MSDDPNPRKMAVKYLLTGFAAAGALLAIAALLAYARNAGIITEALSERVIQVIIGLGFAAYANIMPKMLYGRPGSVRAAAWMQAVLRVGGWAMTLAGLAYAALWAFAPLVFADIASMIVIMAGAAVMMGYTLVTLMICRRTRVG
jgi:hypothetical protein